MIIPRPTHYDPEPGSDLYKEQSSIRRCAWVKWYLNCPNWKCGKCGAVNLGRNPHCVYCKIQHKTITPRPEGVDCLTNPEISKY